jgi:NAD+ synthase (glutamine-hydrolysing)
MQLMCDLGRLYFDGCAAIFCNGNIIAMSSQFSLSDVEVVVGVLDLEDVKSFGTSASRSSQGSQEPAYQRIEVPISLSRRGDQENPLLQPSPPIEVEYPRFEEEIANGMHCSNVPI